jgi:hypothetical protein
MTYLQIVNKVLRLMREDEILSVASPGDVVATLVCDFVNDAKRTVEDAHTWSNLRGTADITTVDGTSVYDLGTVDRPFLIEYIMKDGTELTQLSRRDMSARAGRSGSYKAEPTHYSEEGINPSTKLPRVRLWNTPDGAYTFTAYGYQPQADLSADADVLLIPTQPVLYLALALAARERGEVGGQTAAELFAVAGRYLSDAIALDASKNELENIWTAV